MLLRRFVGASSPLAVAAGHLARSSHASPSWATTSLAPNLVSPTALTTASRQCSSTSSTGGSSALSSSPSTPNAGGGNISTQRPGQREPSINCVTLIGVVHDIQTGYVFEDAVTQFTLTTTSLDTTNPTQECVVEKDHHTVRCFGDVFSQETKQKLSEGNVVCVNGRLRLNPQLEPSCNKYYYFPYIQVQPPHGQVSVVYGDRRAPPAPVSATTGEVDNSEGASGANNGGAAAGGTSS